MLQERVDLQTEGNVLLDKPERTADEDSRAAQVSERLKVLNEAIAHEELLREQVRNAPAPGVPAEVRTAPDKFASFGEQLQAVARAQSPNGTVDRRLYKAASGANEGVGSEGGFLVQQDFATDLFSQAFGQSAILSRCRPLPMSTGANSTKIVMIDETSRANGSRWGGVLAYWAAEAATVTATQPKFRDLNIDLKKLFGLAYATEENLADAPQLQSVVGEAFTEEMVFKVEDGVIEGTGAGMPLGVLNAGCTVSVSKETGQAAASIVYENLTKMWARMHPRFKANAVWLINPDVNPALDSLALSVGTGALPANYISYGTDGVMRIKGKPVIEVEYASTLGTVGDIMLADFSQYYLAQKNGVQAASSIHVRFIYDEMTFRFIYRVDGQPRFASALTPFKGSNTLSPFVTLATRA
jgi:HK97 family phage major capsid protein